MWITYTMFRDHSLFVWHLLLYRPETDDYWSIASTEVFDAGGLPL